MPIESSPNPELGAMNLEQLKEWQSKNPNAGLFAATLETLDDQARTVDVLFYTGTTVLRYDWLREELYYLRFKMAKESFDLSILKAAGQVLDGHRNLSVEDVFGVIKDAWWDEKRNAPVARMLFSDRNDKMNGIWRDVSKGIIRNVSMGVRWDVANRVDVSEPGARLRTYEVTLCQPYEISLVPVPADAFAGFLSATETSSAPAADKPDGTREASEINQRTLGIMPQELNTPQGTAEKGPNADQIRTEALAAERKRQTDIRLRGERMGADKGAIDTACNNGTSLEDFTEAFFDGKIAKQEATATHGHAVAAVTRDEADTRMQGMTEHLMHRLNPAKNQVTELSRQYTGKTLVDLGRECLAARGVNVVGKTKQDIAQLALHSTSDFPNALANVMSKRLRDDYAVAPRTWEPLYQPTTVPDFKAISLVQLSAINNLKQVTEGGEYQYVTMTDGKQTYQVLKYGAIIGFTWESMVNDDLLALQRTSAKLARANVRLESELAWAPIVNNVTMGYDSVALFHATHGNLAAAGAAIGITAVGEARAAMRRQRELPAKVSGSTKTTETDFLNLSANYIIAGEDQETIIDQFTAQITPNSNSQVNPFASLRKIIEPRLTPASGAKPWFLSSDLSQSEIGLVARLEGETGLHTEERMGFSVDGIEIKVRNVVGFSIIEHRGIYKNPGL
jgi:hypothetical protein